MGLIPKKQEPNKFRLIVDLSSPQGKSVNDGITRELCSLRYASVDEAVAMVQALGKGTRLVKIDLKETYRQVPVHPDDFHLLGIEWEGQTYVDRALPFGLRSAPKIFNAVADFIAWVLHCNGIAHQLHYLDDFLFLGAPDSEEATAALETVTRTLACMGIPVAIHKTEGPSTMLTFLGIVIDTQKCELRLPGEKLVRLQAMLEQWATMKRCRRKSLESLLGYLSHAATVVRYGRTFLRQLFSLLNCAQQGHHFVYLTPGARADLSWWRHFLLLWNGLSFFTNAPPSVVVTSDASGSFGCGAFSLGCGWFQLKWPENWQSIHISSKELVPVVIASALWGHTWRGKHVCFRTGNMAVVDILCSRTSRDPLLMHLVRCLVFYASVYHFEFSAKHVAGVDNTAADAISRDSIVLFASMFPQVPQISIPRPVAELLVEIQPDWGSRKWTALFRDSWTKESRSQHGLPTNQAGGSTSSSAKTASIPRSQ